MSSQNTAFCVIIGSLMDVLAKAPKSKVPDEFYAATLSSSIDFGYITSNVYFWEIWRGFGQIKEVSIKLDSRMDSDQLGSVYSELFKLFSRKSAILLEEIEAIKTAFNL